MTRLHATALTALLAAEHALIALLLCSCAADVPTQAEAVQRVFATLTLTEVPRAEWDPVRAGVADCLGVSDDLADWTVWTVAESSQSCTGGLTFECSGVELTQCEATAPPPGRTEAECPCRCSGLTDHAQQQIALAPDRLALRHELVHALTGRDDGVGDWSCE